MTQGNSAVRPTNGLYLTRENAVDLQRTGTIIGKSPRHSGENLQILSKTRVCITACPRSHWSPYVRYFVYNKPKVKFMQTSNRTEHYRKGLHWVTGTKQDCTLAQRLFNWNESINDHKQGSVGFPQQKQLPRSPENFSFRNTTFPVLVQSSVNITLYLETGHCNVFYVHLT